MLTSLLCQAAGMSSRREENTVGHGKCVNIEITCLVRWSQVISSHCGFYCLMVPEPSLLSHTHTKAIYKAHLLDPHTLGLGWTKGPQGHIANGRRELD